MKTGGIVLCGGESRRMGRPKGELPFGDETMLGRIVRIVRTVVDPVVLVAAPHTRLHLTDESVSVVRDPVPGQGPLRGIVTGLQALSGRCEAAFATGCDSPLLSPEVIRFLAAEAASWDAAVPAWEDRLLPLPAVYACRLLPTVLRRIDSGQNSVQGLLKEIRTRVVQAETLERVDPDLLSLVNVNTWEEYQQALRKAGVSGG